MDTRAAQQRLRIYSGVLVFFFMVLIVRLFFLQIIYYDYYQGRAYWHKHRPRVLDPLRGSILDRRGVKLAVTEAAFDLNVQLALLKRYSLENVGRLLHIAPQALLPKLQAIETRVRKQIKRRMAKFAKASRRRRTRKYRELVNDYYHRPYPLLKNLQDFDQVADIYINSQKYPGLVIRTRAVRKYPLGDCAPHILGRMGFIYKEEYENGLREKGYTIRSQIGRAGLEKVYEETLRGRGGEQIISWDVHRREKGYAYRIPPRDGANLYLTIDAHLQQVAEKALDQTLAASRRHGGRATGGAAVVMDVHSGEVLVLATTPRYDNNQLSTQYKNLVHDPLHPLVNRAISNVRIPPPGSVFKIMIAIAALEERLLDPQEVIYCRGYLYSPRAFRCNGHHGAVNLYGAIESSCNVYFYKIGERLGEKRLVKWAHLFGFGTKTGIELPGEAAGFVPTARWKQRHWHQPWFPGDNRLFAIGQSIEVTPLQVARAMAAVATGGRMPQPHIIRAVYRADNNGQPIYIPPGPVQRVPFSRRSLNILKRAMWRVLYGRRGTARRIARKVKAFGVVGKTGTAEVGKKGDHAWFAGFAPCDHPRYSFAVFVEHGGHGGTAAAPIAAKILTSLFTQQEGKAQNK